MPEAASRADEGVLVQARVLAEGTAAAVGGSFAEDVDDCAGYRMPRSVIRVVMPRGSWSPQATADAGLQVGGVAIRAAPLANAQLGGVALAYAVRFPAGFAWARGGTLPGLWVVGALRAVFGWHADGRGRVHWASDGQPLPLERKRTWHFVSGRWHFLQLRLDAALHLEAWADDELVTVGASTTTECAMGLQTGVLLTAFYGGSTEEWAAPADTFIDMGSFAIYTKNVQSETRKQN